MAGKSLTAATAVYMLGISDLFPVPQELQGFSADDVFSTEPVPSAQVLMGVDGKLSGGFIFHEVVQNIMLQADSDSNFVFDQWYAAQQQQEEAFIANAVITLRAVGSKWTMTRGFLTSYKPIPDAKKILQYRPYQITWESVISSAVA